MRVFAFCIALLAATTAVAADLPRVFIEATETVDSVVAIGPRSA